MPDRPAVAGWKKNLAVCQHFASSARYTTTVVSSLVGDLEQEVKVSSLVGDQVCGNW